MAKPLPEYYRALELKTIPHFNFAVYPSIQYILSNYFTQIVITSTI